MVMIQEVKPKFDATKQDWMLPLYKQSKTCSLKLDTPVTLSLVHISSREGPKIPKGAVFTQPQIKHEVYAKCIQEYHVWSLAWVVGSRREKQLVPAFGGFISATGAKPSQKSTILHPHLPTLH